MHAQGKDAVPEAVDHVKVVIDPRQDRTWLTLQLRKSSQNRPGSCQPVHDAHLPAKTRVHLQGKDAVPEAVDHVKLVVDPREDRTWLQSEPQVPTDGVHSFDAIGPAEISAENWSEAVKRLKPRLLQRIIDAFKCAWDFSHFSPV